MSRLFEVFVPISPQFTLQIHPGSAIVACMDQSEASNIEVDYEGNIYDVPSLRDFTVRLRQAAGRAAVRYPTVARSTITHFSLRRVGTYDLDTQTLDVTNQQALDAWLNP